VSDGSNFSSKPLPETIRAFIAVRIPKAVLAQLVSAQEQLKRKFSDVSWTRAEAMHVTLQFLGNIESARLLELEGSLRRAIEQIPSFEMELAGFGSFGNRVLWIGISHGIEPLTSVAEAVRRVTNGFDVHEEERGFNAHITMGRLRHPSRDVVATLRELDAPAFGSWRVQEVELIRSELSPHGSRYTTLATVPLGRA
jgi:RNA 2',3'-cyclic 3'-phosphodiesterase